MTKSLRVKCFNRHGIDEFQKLLHDQKAIDKSKRVNFPSHLLTDSSLVVDYRIKAQIDFTKKFKTSQQLGDYLLSVLGPSVEGTDTGLWCWLACGFMDVIAPKGTNILADERYIPAEIFDGDRVKLKMQRHLLRTPYQIVCKTSSSDLDPKFSKLSLNKPPEQHGSFLEICFSNNKIQRSKRVQQTICKLYDDGTGKKAKGFDASPDKKDPNSQKGRGGLRRFAKLIVPRVQENFDLEIMSPDEFIEAWGSEITGSTFFKP